MRTIITDQAAEEIQKHFTSDEISNGILSLRRVETSTDKTLLLEEKLVEEVMRYTFAHRDEKDVQPIVDVLCALANADTLAKEKTFHKGIVLENSK